MNGAPHEQPRPSARAPGRDRDDAGRARSARPRDGLGRPLPRGAQGTPTVPDDLVLDPESALAMAQDLLDARLPFQAHEVLEAMWKQAPADERDLWQGLAQVAVGITHVRRGNTAGGARLLRRGARHLEPCAGARPHGIDVDGIRRTATAAAEALDAGADPDLLLRLRSAP